MPTHVVIGFAEALAAPEVVWSLADYGFEITAFTRRNSKPALRWSKYVSIVEIEPPEINAAQSLSELKSILATRHKESPRRNLVLLPLDDASVWLLNALKKENDTILAGPSGFLAEFALSKLEQLSLAKSVGFLVPPTKLIRTQAQAEQESPDFPIFFKPAWAITKKGNQILKGSSWICNDMHEFRQAINEWKGAVPMIIQPYVWGIGEGVFGLAIDQKVIGLTAHRRIRMMNPLGSGSSACTNSELDSNIKCLSEKLIRASSWQGLFMIELLRDKTDKLWFMEFNGRCWGSIALARRRGFEYPAWGVMLKVQPNCVIDIPPLPKRNILCRHLGRELLHIAFVARGPSSDAIKNWPSLLKTVYEICHLSPYDRCYNFRKDDIRVFVMDTIYTLRDIIRKREHS